MLQEQVINQVNIEKLKLKNFQISNNIFFLPNIVLKREKFVYKMEDRKRDYNGWHYQFLGQG